MPLRAASPSPPISIRSNLAEQAYAQLKGLIHDFQLLPGDRFSENEMGTRLGVSRTPVREALFRLRNEGFLDLDLLPCFPVRDDQKAGILPALLNDPIEQGHFEAEGRIAAHFDIVDRGPRVADSLRLVMDMVADGHALCVVGNHEAKVEKWLAGKNVTVSHGLQATVDEMEAAGAAFKARAKLRVSRPTCR